MISYPLNPGGFVALQWFGEYVSSFFPAGVFWFSVSGRVAPNVVQYCNIVGCWLIRSILVLYPDMCAGATCLNYISVV